MYHPLTPHGSSDYYITSVQYQRYLDAIGCIPPQLIVLGAEGVQGPKFTVTAAGGENTYTISISGGFVRGRDDRVYSFQDGLAEEWVIIFREADNIYTVQKKADSTAWTAPDPGVPDLLQQILLKPLDTPIFPHQLFKFDLVRE